MIGLDDILNLITWGTTLSKAIISLKNHIQTIRSGAPPANSQPLRIEALDKKVGDLELLARRQAARIGELETGLESASTAINALADRVGTIFWIASMAGAMGLVALVLSIVALVR